MGIATLIRELDGFNGDARLYRTSGGELPEYVVVSAVDVPFSGAETCIFQADANGEVTDWGRLEGSYRGGLDHEEALRRAGYDT